MRKRIRTKDRALLRSVNSRLRKGMTWPEIGEDLKLENWRKEYNRLAYITVPGPDGTLVLVDQVQPLNQQEHAA